MQEENKYVYGGLAIWTFSSARVPGSDVHAGLVEKWYGTQVITIIDIWDIKGILANLAT